MHSQLQGYIKIDQDWCWINNLPQEENGDLEVLSSYGLISSKSVCFQNRYNVVSTSLPLNIEFISWLKQIGFKYNISYFGRDDHLRIIGALHQILTSRYKLLTAQWRCGKHLFHYDLTNATFNRTKKKKSVFSVTFQIAIASEKWPKSKTVLNTVSLVDWYNIKHFLAASVADIYI